MLSIRVACIAGLLLMAMPAAAQTVVPPVLPLLSLTDGQLFPGLSMEVQIIEPSSRLMVEEAIKGNSIIGVVTLRLAGSRTSAAAARSSTRAMSASSTT